MFLLTDEWKNHPEVKDILWIQARNKTDSGESITNEVLVSSDDEENVDVRKEETEDSESGDDSDNEYDDDEDETSEPEMVAINKFSLLGEED